MIRSPARAIAARLERGTGSVAVAGLSRPWSWLADPRRPLQLPAQASVIGVGGAVLGGSYKTPFVEALGRALVERGHRVAVVGHGYRGRPLRAREVRADDDPSVVGDEALLLSRRLSGMAPVFVAPSRHDAVERAARYGNVVIVDGLLQTRPSRLAHSVLCLDAATPWGAGRCPPAGDLRARVRRLLAAADTVVCVGERASASRALSAAGAILAPARFELSGAVDGQTVPWERLRQSRVGVVLSVARPHRILETLRGQGVVPVVTALGVDHAVPRAPRGVPAVDLWIATEKCATKMVGEERARLVLLGARIEVPLSVVEQVEGGIQGGVPAPAHGWLRESR